MFLVFLFRMAAACFFHIMNNLSDIGKIKEILSKHGFTFSKSLGQNFLINPSVCPRMAEYSEMCIRDRL